MIEASYWFRLCGNIVLCASAFFATLGVVVYVRVPWWRSPMGRHLMIKMAVLALILDLGVIRLMFGEAPWFLLLRLVVYALLPLVLAQRVWLLWQAQRTPAHPDADDPAAAGMPRHPLPSEGSP